MENSDCFYLYQPGANFLVKEDDSADFLQSQFTNELRPFEVGRCTYGLWLDVKGKVIGDSVVVCEDNTTYRVISDCCKSESLVTHLKRYIIADDVVIKPQDLGYVFELYGDSLKKLDLKLPRKGYFDNVDSGILFAMDIERYRIVTHSTEGRDEWFAKLVALGFKLMNKSEYGFQRIAAAIPLIPEEIGSADLPGEGQLERDAISFTKGCYLGQEIVARMHNMGKVRRRLYVLEGSGAVPKLPENLFELTGKLVGELRSAYLKDESWLGVALLKTRHVKVGSELRYKNKKVIVVKPLREDLESV